MSEEAGHEAADQHPAEPGVEGLGLRGGLHADGGHLPHAHGAAPCPGAPGQASAAALASGASGSLPWGGAGLPWARLSEPAVLCGLCHGSVRQVAHDS